ncbi:MAG: prepilin-type N-terminal cleavage/methylation domain-containing protein [Candidatus Omnitrophica bacterium]|nr:prepilin-type N-terminal cleavage/methylation domain-containing protein [Candidatus Omnitrophota bacterium]
MMKIRGFTLLEILIAIAIVAIILVVVQSSYVKSVQAIKDCRERIEIYQIGRFVLDRMPREISCAYSGKTGLFFNGDDKKMEFTSASKPQSEKMAESDIWELKYSLGEEKDERDRVILWRQADEDRQELAENVKDINFYYLPPGENSSPETGWVRAWDSGKTKSLPKAVKIELTLEDNYGEKGFFTTTVFIPASSS